MKNIDNISVLPLDINMFGTIFRIYPVLLWDESDATLVDTGFPGMFEQLQQAVIQTGVSFRQIKRIIITHQDWDHIGTLPDIIRYLGNQVEVFAHIIEKPYIDGTLPPIKMTPERIAARLAAMPPELREKAAVMFANLPTAQVHKTLNGGELLPFHGGIEVIHTPGHTPGHICLYLKAHRLLIAGDQLRLENGQLVGPSAVYTVDMPIALESLKKLVDYNIEHIICYHGGNYNLESPSRIADLAAAKN